MIKPEQFDRLRYILPKSFFIAENITEFIGLDSEADMKGRPFLFCFSDGRDCTAYNIFGTLFAYYAKKHIVCYNLKYDSGAILYNIPEGNIIYDSEKNPIEIEPGKAELWLKNVTTCIVETEKTRIDYIPHKYLRVSRRVKIDGKSTVQWVKIWDICQFYKMELDKAAKKYLGEGKKEIETKRFTLKYIKKNLPKIKEYCIVDASLTARLANYLLEKLNELEINVSSLYSTASISFQYFRENGDIIDIWRYWKHYNELILYSIEAYQGGKFEVTARGKFDGYEYDITSAYPYEIANLVDIRQAEVLYSKRYCKKATYGFLRVKIKVHSDFYMPCGMLIKNTRIYAIGEYTATITKTEYDYFKKFPKKVKISIISAYWLIVPKISYPYRKTVYKLFELKDFYKGKDAMIYNCIKIILNGFYGKMAQCIENWKGEFNAGVSFNPIYASIITANTRLRVTEIQNLLDKDCIAVHTDSVITLVPLSPKLCKPVRTMRRYPQLGAFEEKVQGGGYIIACGCYQIGTESAFKGFRPRKKKNGEYETWEDLLTEFSRRKSIPYSALRVESWIEAQAKGHPNLVNVFKRMPKDISLNVEVKRIWPLDEFKCRDFLHNLYYSEPRIIQEREGSNEEKDQ